MKTKIFKHIGLSVLSVMIVSGVVYAATNITSFTQIIADGDTISSTWYNAVSNALKGDCGIGNVVQGFDAAGNKICVENASAPITSETVILANSVHYGDQCTGLGGEVYTIENGEKICKFGVDKGPNCDYVLSDIDIYSDPVAPNYVGTLIGTRKGYKLVCPGSFSTCPTGWTKYTTAAEPISAFTVPATYGAAGSWLNVTYDRIYYTSTLENKKDPVPYYEPICAGTAAATTCNTIGNEHAFGKMPTSTPITVDRYYTYNVLSVDTSIHKVTTGNSIGCDVGYKATDTHSTTTTYYCGVGPIGPAIVAIGCY
ncbi:MAG: hypothetical protein PHS92_05085 [Candidatus Gracilibacteria bacterium]|nr:hypothetical protein [Candidatus Gracilibacteria bacterium]